MMVYYLIYSNSNTTTNA